MYLERDRAFGLELSREAASHRIQGRGARCEARAGRPFKSARAASVRFRSCKHCMETVKSVLAWRTVPRAVENVAVGGRARSRICARSVNERALLMNHNGCTAQVFEMALACHIKNQRSRRGHGRMNVRRARAACGACDLFVGGLRCSNSAVEHWCGGVFARARSG